MPMYSMYRRLSIISLNIQVLLVLYFAMFMHEKFKMSSINHQYNFFLPEGKYILDNQCHHKLYFELQIA